MPTFSVRPAACEKKKKKNNDGSHLHQGLRTQEAMYIPCSDALRSQLALSVRINMPVGDTTSIFPERTPWVLIMQGYTTRRGPEQVSMTLEANRAIFPRGKRDERKTEDPSVKRRFASRCQAVPRFARLRDAKHQSIERTDTHVESPQTIALNDAMQPEVAYVVFCPD